MERVKYEDCEIEVIVFEGQDVIVTSTPDPVSDFETPIIGND